MEKKIIVSLSPRTVSEREVAKKLYRLKAVVEDAKWAKTDRDTDSSDSLKIKIPPYNPEWTHVDFSASYDTELGKKLLEQFEVQEVEGLNGKEIQAYILNYHLFAVEPASPSPRGLEEEIRNPVTLIYPNCRLYQEFFKVRTKISEVRWYKPNKLRSNDSIVLSVPYFEPPQGYSVPSRNIHYYRDDLEQLFSQFMITKEDQLKDVPVTAYFIGGDFFRDHELVGLEPRT